MHYEIIQLLKQINKKDSWDIANFFISLILSLSNIILIIFTVKYAKNSFKTSETTRKDTRLPILIIKEIVFTKMPNFTDQFNIKMLYSNIGFEYFNFLKIRINRSTHIIDHNNQKEHDDNEYIELSNINNSEFFYNENEKNEITVTYTDLFGREIKSIFNFNGNIIPKDTQDLTIGGYLPIKNTSIKYE